MLRRTLIAPLAFAATLAAPALAQITVGPVINPTTGNRYYRLAAATYASARSQALALGGDLVTIPNAATNSWIQTNIAAASGNALECFIGFNDIAVEGSFVWSSGDPNFYANWNAGEPNNSGNEDAGAMNPASGTWNDLSVSTARPAIFQITGPIRVPQEYATIQGAINAAIDGQTILVSPGTYTESVNFGVKKLVVRSQSGPMVTTIRTVDTSYGLIINGGQGPETVLDGFTVVPQTSTSQLVTLAGSPSVRNCRLGGPATVAVVTFGSSVVSDCLLSQCGLGFAAAGAGTSKLQNSTVAGNSTAIYGQASADGPVMMEVVNCILAGYSTAVNTPAGTGARFSYCDAPSGITGLGVITGNPMFVSAPGPNGTYELSDDYSLQASSPCIDAGNNAARSPVAGVTSLDIAGHSRYQGSLSAPVIDMGALEFNGASCPADFDGDGTVDFFDYDAFVAAFEIGC